MLYARVTQIEAFRRARDYKPKDGSDSAFDSAAVFAAIAGTFEGNDKTMIGTSFHVIVEKGLMCLSTELEKPWPPITSLEKEETITRYIYPETGVKFNEMQVDIALDYRDGLPGMISEVPLEKVYRTAYGDLTLNGTMDVLHGNHIRDIKCRFSSLDPSDYINSCQWRFYLSMAELNEFFYDVFEFRSYSDGLSVISCPTVKHEPIPCLRYENLENDCNLLASEFMEYAHSRGLKKHLLKQSEKYA